MEFIAALWLPIILSTFAIFIVSAFIWMATPMHTKDIKMFPDEPGLRKYLSSVPLERGLYMWPQPSDGNMNNPEYSAAYQDGPWGSMTILDRRPSFPINLVRVLLCYLAISAFIAWLGWAAMPNATDKADVFLFVFVAGVLGFCAGGLPNSIMFGKHPRFFLTDFIDGVIFAIVAAVLFMLFWPYAPVASI